MTDEDAFVHAILNDPDDDTPRLVFADWLDEHDRASHAELIRVQCELARLKGSREPKAKARRESLAAREKELLKQPEFFPTWPTGKPKPRYEVFKHGSDCPKLKYERGFITAIRFLDNELMAPEWAQSPWHTLLREGKALSVELQPDQGGFVGSSDMQNPPPLTQGSPVELDPDDEVPPPSFLGPYGLEGLGYEMADLAKHPTLSRVTRLYVFEGHLDDNNLGVLARSPLLTQLRDVFLLDCHISLGAFKALVTSPSIKQLRTLFMDLVYLMGGRDSRRVDQLWALAASSPNMASLDRLWIDFIDNKSAPALVKSPHLKASIQLCPEPVGEMNRAAWKRELAESLNAANLKALRQRYPGTPF